MKNAAIENELLKFMLRDQPVISVTKQSLEDIQKTIGELDSNSDQFPLRDDNDLKKYFSKDNIYLYNFMTLADSLFQRRLLEKQVKLYDVNRNASGPDYSDFTEHKGDARFLNNVNSEQILNNRQLLTIKLY